MCASGAADAPGAAGPAVPQVRSVFGVATQNAQDLLGTDEGSVVATNCAIVLLGGHRPAETARMEHAFGLTPAQRHFLETAARGESC